MDRAKPYALSVAPMMARTDRHFRMFLRGITRRTLLYTEMVTAKAILHGDRSYLLDFSAEEAPLSLQLGGDDPSELAECAKIANDWGYDEVNLNVGCPSDRVQKGRFGACLMADPDTVARAVEAMRTACSLPVTVKHRIGIDDMDSYDHMRRFVEIVSQAGCRRFSVHARKAWLQGLSPKENREVPPLRYGDVHRLKRDLPELLIEINGGLKTLDDVETQLAHVDGVMIGRAAYDDPFVFADVDRRFFGEPEQQITRPSVIENLFDYVDAWIAEGGKLHDVSRHLLQVFRGTRGARTWRRHLSQHAHIDNADSECLRAALKLVSNLRERDGENRPIFDEKLPGVRPLTDRPRGT
jgi:tRNA-dihydrouridine synthase A